MKVGVLVLMFGLSVAPMAIAQMPPPPAQDPCKVLGIIAAYGVVSGTSGCVTPRTFLGPADVSISVRDTELNTMLAARIASELRVLIGEIQALRSEMTAYKVGLSQAQAGFDAAAKTALSNQETWRKSALEQTLADVQQIPARLAGNDDLRKALISTLMQDLPKDPIFVQTLRDALR